MIISIASGKGGTGKTTVATNLAATIAQDRKRVRILDTDVEAPNCHIFLNPTIETELPVNLLVPEVDHDKCTLCGECARICEFNAIAVFGKRVLVFPELCQACGGCTLACPEDAITEVEHKTGFVRLGRAGKLEFVDGLLAIGEAKAPAVIRDIKKHLLPDDINIIDSPPGTSCPVVEAVKVADFVVLVTEPTPFGFNDLVLAVEVIKKLHLPHGVIINRCDIGDDRVVNYCQAKNIPILMEIPEDRRIAESYSTGQLLIEALPEYKEKFLDLFDKIKVLISQ